jgi:uncharacterized repeat protein (TIGR01451 family)
VKLTVCSIVVSCLATLATAGTLTAQAAVPGLIISVTDGHNRARPGERLDYTVRVTNDGAAAARQLKITMTMPSYLRFSGSQGVRPANGKLTWPASLEPGKTARFSVRALLTRTPHDLNSIAAVACADDSNGRTIVCSAHLDALPGTSPAKTEANAPPATGRTSRPASGLAPKIIVAATVIAVLLTLIAVGARRSRPKRQQLRHRHSG